MLYEPSPHKLLRRMYGNTDTFVSLNKNGELSTTLLRTQILTEKENWFTDPCLYPQR